MGTEVDEQDETEVTEPDTNDDSGDETDDSTTDDTETSDDTEGGSEESVEQYLDIKALPPHLMEMGKRMQASHTKKMMQITAQAEKKAKDLVSAEEAKLSDKYATYIAHASALAELSKHPSFALFYEDLMNNRPYGASVQKNGKGDDDEDAGETVANMTVDQLAKRLFPLMKATADRSVKPLIDSKASEELEQAKGKLLNFQKHKPEILRLMSERGLDVYMAHSIAAKDDIIAAAVAEATTKAKEVSKTIPKKAVAGGTAKGGSPVLSDKTKRTLRESINYALQTLKTA